MTHAPADRRPRTLLLTAAALAALGSCGPGGGTSAPPPAPTGLTVTATTATTVTLAWTATPGATAYTLERRTGTQGSAPVSPPAGTATTYTDTGLTPGTAYTYRVAVTTPAGTSAPSADVTATTAPPDPDAPTAAITQVTNGVSGTPELVTVAGSAGARSGTLARVTVTWGDGSAPTDVTGSAAAFTAPHTYAASGTYAVAVTATDSGGRTTTATRTVDVTRFQTGSQLHVVFDDSVTPPAPRDLSGNRRTGTYTGSGCTAATADRYSKPAQAERFNDPAAAACTVSVAGGADTQPVPLPGDVTASVWVRADGTRLGRGGWVAGQLGGAMRLVVGTDGRVTAHVGRSGGPALSVTDPAPLGGNVWTHYVARLQLGGAGSSTLRLYRKDGTDPTVEPRAVGSASGSGDYALPSPAAWTVAEAQGGTETGPGDRPLSGDIDDLRLYDRALAEYEISALARLDRYPRP